MIQKFLMPNGDYIMMIELLNKEELMAYNKIIENQLRKLKFNHLKANI